MANMDASGDEHETAYIGFAAKVHNAGADLIQHSSAILALT
jgi:hypothetical protein